MGFRKFGQGEDQKVELEEQELRKTAEVKWTEKDKEALQKENEE